MTNNEFDEIISLTEQLQREKFEFVQNFINMMVNRGQPRPDYSSMESVFYLLKISQLQKQLDELGKSIQDTNKFVHFPTD